MNTYGAAVSVPWSTVLEAIQRLLSTQPSPIVVALDGGSGAGKSTLAALIGHEIDTALIPLDDFFAGDIPDHHWAEFSVQEKFQHVFDLGRLRKAAVEPLLAGQPARWHPFDFQSGLRFDGTYGLSVEVVERNPARLILIEGAYSAQPALADILTLAVLIDVPAAERHTRLAAREDPIFLARWHQRWDSVERYYFGQVCPKSSFDFVVHS